MFDDTELTDNSAHAELHEGAQRVGWGWRRRHAKDELGMGMTKRIGGEEEEEACRGCAGYDDVGEHRLGQGAASIGGGGTDKGVRGSSRAASTSRS